MYNNQNNYYDQNGYSQQQGYQEQQYSNQQYGYTTNPEVEEEPKKSKANIVLIIIILILLILLVLSFMMKKEKYAVVFVNGENVEAVVIEEGKTVSEKVVTTDGFTGWYLGEEKYDFSRVVTGNVILKAKYDNTKTYKVTFDSNGGNTIPTQQIKENELVPKPTDPTQNGYNFIEWQLDGKTYDFSQPVVKDITLKAKWERNTDEISFTVTFDTDGGNTISNQVIKEKGKVAKPTNPTKTGYTFVEWQLDGKKYDFNAEVTTNITLKAVWEAKEEVTVTFDTDGGNKIEPKKVYKNEKVGTLPTPKKDGYSFGGWYSGTTKYTSSTVVKANVTLKAKWLTAEELAMLNAKAAIKSSYTIEKAGTEIKPTYDGCTITHVTQSELAKITRGLKDTNKTLKFEIKCGNNTETVTSKGIIKASPYKYVATANSNMQNYDLTVKNGSSTISNSGNIYSMDGNYLSDLSSGKAVINNDDIEGYPNFQMIFSNDTKTIYVIKK